MLRENYLATNTIYVSLSHDNDYLLKKYSLILDKIFYKISLCEKGDSIHKYLKYPVSLKDFKRLN